MAERIDINKIIDLAGIKQGFTELEKLLNGVANQAEALNQKLGQYREGAGMSVSELTKQLAALEDQLKKQTPASKQGKQNIDNLASSMANAGKQIENATKDIENFDKASEELTRQMKENKEAAARLKEEYEAIRKENNADKTKEITERYNKLKEAQERIKKSLKETNKGLKETTDGLKGVGDALGGVESIPEKAKPAADSIAGLKEQIKALTKEREALSQSQDKDKSDELAAKIKGLRQELKRLNDEAKGGAIPELPEKVKPAIGSLEDITDRLKEAKKEFAAVSQATDPEKFQEAAQRVRLLAAEQKRLRDQLKATSRSLGGINENLEFQQNTYNNVRANIKRYKQELGDAEIGSREFQRIQAKLNNELEKEIQIREKQPSLFAKRIRQAAGESREVKELADKLRDLRKELVKAPSDTVFDKIQAEIKQTEQDIEDLIQKQQQRGGAGGGGLFGNLFGGIVAGGAAGVAQAGIDLLVDGLRSVSEEVNEIIPQLRSVQGVSGATGDELNDLTGDLRGLAKTFDVDFNEALDAANVASKEFGVPLENIQGTLAEVLAGDIRGSALSDIIEFAPQLAQAGVSFEEFAELTRVQQVEGFFDNKLLDTIKEGALRLGDLTKGQKDVLATLGDVGQEIQDTFARGDRVGAIQLTAQAINELNEAGQETQPIISNIFGGAGEDLGKRGFEILANLGNINTELSDLQRQQLQLLDSRTEFEQSLTELAAEFTDSSSGFAIFFNQLKAFGVELLTDVVRFFKEIGADLRRIFGFFGDGNRTLFETLQIFNDFNPVVQQLKFSFQLVADAVRALIRGIKILIAFGASLDEALGSPIKRFAEFVGDAFTSIQQAVPKIKDTFINTFNGILSGAATFTQRLVGGILGGFDKVREALGAFGEFLPEDLEDRFNKFANKVRTGFIANIKKLDGDDTQEAAEETGESIGEAIGKGLNKSLGVELQKAGEKIKKELPKVDLIQPADPQTIEEAEGIAQDFAKLQEENAERVRQNNETADIIAEAKKLERQKKNEAIAAQFANALGAKLEEKAEERINRRYDQQREALEAQGATQEALAALEERRQRRLARQQILVATLRAGIEAFIAALKNGDTVAQAGAKAAQAGYIAAALGTIAAFEKGGLVSGGEQIIRINEKGEEFVVNAEATRKHLPVLQAINAGVDFAPAMGMQASNLERQQPAPSQPEKIDYDRLGRSVAKHMPKYDIQAEANRITAQEKTRGLIRRYEIERATVLPKFGKKK